MIVTTSPGLRRVEHVMGMAVSVHLADPLPASTLDALAGDVFAWLRAVDRRFSTFRADSEVNRLQRGDITHAQCSADLRTVLDQCAELWRRTDGWFDVYATGRLDPSGFVKGWAVQIASDLLVRAGSANHCVNAGGDVRVRGRPAPGQDWRIGIRHPNHARRMCWVLTGTDLAVATSGTYAQGFHVIDPRRGTPARDLCSVTVVGQDLGLADAAATAALAMGRPGLDWLASLPDQECAVITAAGQLLRSDDLPALAS